jgi:hypothetical protein
MPDIPDDTQQDDAARESGDATILVYQSPLTRIKSVEDTNSLLDLAKADHAFDPSVFDENPPFFWRTVPSTQLIDSYGTRMMDDSLQNFAADATDGRSFMAAHDSRDMPLGRSLRGEYKNGRTSGGKRTEVDFYTIPGMKTRTFNTDDFILGVRSGINHDVSIGFHGGEIRCSVCGERWWSFFGMSFSECEHMPGMTYKKLDAKGAETDTDIVASGDVYGAHMSEVSAVYDGATPGAAIIGILRAERMVDAGRVSPDNARKLEARYRISLPVQHNWQGSSTRQAGAASTTSEEEDTMPKDDAPKTGANDNAAGDNNSSAAANNSAAGDNNSASGNNNSSSDVAAAESRGRAAGVLSVRSMLAEYSIIKGDDQRDLPTILREIGQQQTQQRSQAADGVQYRKDLVATALEEGVRALGESFNADTYRPVLESADIDTIKRFRDDWKKVGDEKLAGGRKTTDVNGHENGTSGQFKPPASVHRG